MRHACARPTCLRPVRRLLLCIALPLAACGGDSPRAAPTLPRQLDSAAQERLVVDLSSADVTTRRAAVEALQGGPALQRRALAALGKRLMEDEDRWVREGAALALRDQDIQASMQVPALIHALRDEDELVRWRAAEALGRIGPLAIGAVEELRRHADDAGEVEVVRAASQRALERILRDPAAAR